MALLQMTLPGVPCVYYGDERGVEGFRDPYNRASFPWDGGRRDCTDIYRNAIAVRKMLPELLVDGEFEPFSSGEDVFGFWRRGEGERVCVLVNASLSEAHTVKVPVGDKQVSDVVSGKVPRVSHGQAEVFLWPLGTSVLHFHDEQRLQAPLERGMGVLCHITSVPNGGWPGTLGAPARRFVDWLAAGGQKYWQVLPSTPRTALGPRTRAWARSRATWACSSCRRRPRWRASSGSATTPSTSASATRTTTGSRRTPPSARARSSWARSPGRSGRSPITPTRRAWRPTPSCATRSRRTAACSSSSSASGTTCSSTRTRAGIKIIGDMPMFVSADSADVWSEPDIFDLDERGYPRRQAGAPGDAFAPDGQNWGNPTFRWDILREQNFGWWLRRFSRMLALYDVVRLDHFIGFSSYFGIPDGKTARDGAYAFGPGAELFKAAERQFGPLPFIAEDLGAITPAVRALVAATGFLGMDVGAVLRRRRTRGLRPAPRDRGLHRHARQPDAGGLLRAALRARARGGGRGRGRHHAPRARE